MIHENRFLGVFAINFGESVFSCKDGYLLFKAFDSGEKLENHKKHQDEAGEYDGIDVSFYADDIGENIAEIRKEDDSDHASPDNDADTELEDGLVVFAFEKVVDALIEHESGEDEDDNLVGLK